MAVRAGFCCDCEPTYDPNCQCACVNCAPKSGSYVDNAPCCWDLVIAGFSATNPVNCSTCSALNRTYKLSATENACQWSGSAGCQCCTADSRAVLDIVEESGDYIARVTLGSDVWEHNFGSTRPNCCAIAGLSLTKAASSTYCTSASATATLSTGQCVPLAVTTPACGNYCLDYTLAPATVEVDFSGLDWTDTARCSACDEAVGVYVLPIVPPAYGWWQWGTTSLNWCQWGSGQIYHLYVTVYAHCSGANIEWSATIELEGGLQETWASYTGTTPVSDDYKNCHSITDLLTGTVVLSLYGSGVSGSAWPCATSTAPTTITLTA